jgi:uncharacterized membrane-anchored protein
VWNKVPEITLYFWIIKILCTTIGETASDYLNATLGFGINKTALVMGALLIAALVLQFAYKKYVPPVYWVVVILVSIVGTLITDKLTDDLGVPLEVTTLVFALILAIVFALWFWSERTLSIRTIYTSKREGFYWAAILATFALGTAAGDYLLEVFGDAFGTIPASTPGGEDLSAHPQAALLVAAAMFGGVIVLAAVGHMVFKWNSVLMFWIAYIFTRPLGANIGDLLTKDPDEGGLGISVAIVNGVFLAIILVLVAYLTVTKKDTRPDPHFIVETVGEQATHPPHKPPEHPPA